MSRLIGLAGTTGESQPTEIIQLISKRTLNRGGGVRDGRDAAIRFLTECDDAISSARMGSRCRGTLGLGEWLDEECRGATVGAELRRKMCPERGDVGRAGS